MSPIRNMIRVTVLVLVWNTASSYKIYQLRIPNGNQVPHPCKPNTFWEGVGHFMDAGSGLKNPFGEDFLKEGSVWTVNLCMKDSDGDGRTNGQELGDADCKWTPNSIASRLAELSHPGICDPWNSPKCLGKNVTHPKYTTQEQWLLDMCKTNTFTCPAVNETGVKSITLRLPPELKVPAKETTYMCKMHNFENMTSPGDFHMVAVEPVLDNTNVIHHMVLYGCTDDTPFITEPFECDILPSVKCKTFLSVWAVGLQGDCYHPNIGIRLGTNGYKNLVIQLHWNNPDKRSTWTDSSGLKLYYTSNRRQYDAKIFMTGLQNFILPPKKQSVPLQSTCTSACTKSFMRGPVHITMAWNHMHLAGAKMSIEVIRGNSRLHILTKEERYNYDSPQVSFFTEKPIQLLPGDELITRCEFNTLKRNKSTLFGKATQEEMCFGFLTYYPKENITEDFCLGEGHDVMYCDPSTYRGCSDLFQYNNYTYLNDTRLYTDLAQNCDPYGPCLDECKEVILSHRKENPCLRDDIFEFIKHQMWRYDQTGNFLINLFSSCDIEVYKALNPNAPFQTMVQASTADKGNNSATSPSFNIIYFVTALVFCFDRL